jgi:cytochrome c
VGPPYRAVAERYDGDKATILKRMQKAVSQGAQGSWTDVTGGAPMPPQPQAAQQTEKLDKIAEWIAGMK